MRRPQFDGEDLPGASLPWVFCNTASESVTGKLVHGSNNGHVMPTPICIRKPHPEIRIELNRKLEQYTDTVSWVLNSEPAPGKLGCIVTCSNTRFWWTAGTTTHIFVPVNPAKHGLFARRSPVVPERE
jgi:hypothetical protein